jgi:hypothetical protein
MFWRVSTFTQLSPIEVCPPFFLTLAPIVTAAHRAVRSMIFARSARFWQSMLGTTDALGGVDVAHVLKQATPTAASCSERLET